MLRLHWDFRHLLVTNAQNNYNISRWSKCPLAMPAGVHCARWWWWRHSTITRSFGWETWSTREINNCMVHFGSVEFNSCQFRPVIPRLQINGVNDGVDATVCWYQLSIRRPERTWRPRVEHTPASAVAAAARITTAAGSRLCQSVRTTLSSVIRLRRS